MLEETLEKGTCKVQGSIDQSSVIEVSLVESPIILIRLAGKNAWMLTGWAISRERN